MFPSFRSDPSRLMNGLVVQINSVQTSRCEEIAGYQIFHRGKMLGRKKKRLAGLAASRWCF
jgi:hypothetical protein